MKKCNPGNTHVLQTKEEQTTLESSSGKVLRGHGDLDSV